MKPHQKKVWVKKTANLADGSEQEFWEEAWFGEDGEDCEWPEIPEWPAEDAGETDWDEENEAYLSQFDDFAARFAAAEEEIPYDIDEKDAYEMNCYFAANDSDLDHGQAWEDKLADMIQEDYEAYVAKGGGKLKGKGKSKGLSLIHI